MARGSLTSFQHPRWSLIARNVGLSLNIPSISVRPAARRRPCHAPRLSQPQPQRVKGKTRVEPPMIVIMSILPSIICKRQPTLLERIAAQLRRTPQTVQTLLCARQTPSPYLHYLPLRPHKRYLAEALALNRPWFRQARRHLHLH
jgi:hypothetical protein